MSQELLDWGKILPGGNREMVKLLRLCVDYGEDRILAIKDSMPSGLIPNVDIIRSYLDAPKRDNIIHFNCEIPVMQSSLAYYDDKCGVVAR